MLAPLSSPPHSNRMRRSSIGGYYSRGTKFCPHHCRVQIIVSWCRELTKKYCGLCEKRTGYASSRWIAQVLTQKCGPLPPRVPQAMVAAPGGTPYDSGLFQFDIYCPPQYPDVPPRVNLMTTGRGTVRFNPNLYPCGNVRGVFVLLSSSWAAVAVVSNPIHVCSNIFIFFFPFGNICT